MKHEIIITFSVLIFAVVITILVLVIFLKIDENKKKSGQHNKKKPMTAAQLKTAIVGQQPFIAGALSPAGLTALSPSSNISVEAIPRNELQKLKTAEYADLHLVLKPIATGGSQLASADGSKVLVIINNLPAFAAPDVDPVVVLTVTVKGKQIGLSLPGSKYLSVTATGLAQSSTFVPLHIDVV